MSYPTKIFGRPARPKDAIKEEIVAISQIGSLSIQVLRWELAEFEISGFPKTDGHFLSFRITDVNGSQDLLQGKSLFFASELLPRIESSGDSSEQGDGIIAPKWHKCDRAWPILNGVKAGFLGQFYFGTTVAYLFSLPHNSEQAYIIFKDEVNRQDAEEHYTDEESRS